MQLNSNVTWQKSNKIKAEGAFKNAPSVILRQMELN